MKTTPKIQSQLSTCFSGCLIVLTGTLFAIGCVFFFVVDALVKIIAIPITFLFGMGVLAFGRARRILLHA